MNTIQEAKEYLRDNFSEGAKCPCCGQFVKLYKRKLNSGMARTLIEIYKHGSENWINVKDHLRKNSLRNNHDWTLLGYWGLIRENEEEPEHGGKTRGEWMITKDGINFVLNKITVASHVHIYNNKFQGYSDERINIIESLGKHFNYFELMNS